MLTWACAAHATTVPCHIRACIPLCLYLRDIHVTRKGKVTAIKARALAEHKTAARKLTLWKDITFTCVDKMTI